MGPNPNLGLLDIPSGSRNNDFNDDFYNIYIYPHFIKSLKCRIHNTESSFHFTPIFISDSWGHEAKLPS